MKAPVILPLVLEQSEVSERLGRLLKSIGVTAKAWPVYGDMTYVLGQTIGRRWPARNLLDLFRNTDDLEFHASNHTTYGAFSGQRARNAATRTARERDQLALLIAGHEPKFLAVEVCFPSASRVVLKGALAVEQGLLPFVLASTSHRDALVQELGDDFRRLGQRLTLVSATADDAALDWLLARMPSRAYDHFARASIGWRPAPNAGVQVIWEDPAPTDALGIGDSLAQAGTQWLRATIESDGLQAHYLAFGPSALGRYYLQRMLPEGPGATREAMTQRVAAVEACELSLEHWLVEHLTIRGTAHAAWQRTQHAIVLASYNALDDGFVPAPDEDPQGWRVCFRAWDGQPEELNDREEGVQ